MVDASIKRVAEILCEFDPQLRDPNAVVFTDEGAVEAWRTRTDMAREILKAIRRPDAELRQKTRSRDKNRIRAR